MASDRRLASAVLITEEACSLHLANGNLPGRKWRVIIVDGDRKGRE